MPEKYVKDKAHNKYSAYCCDDIDVRVGALEEAVAALVAQTVPDGAVTLAKLAQDARSYAREINAGRLIAEWIGTRAEYKAHVKQNGGEPLNNVKYTITDDPAPAQVITEFYPDGQLEYPVGTMILAYEYKAAEAPVRKLLSIGDLYIANSSIGGYAPYAFTSLTDAKLWMTATPTEPVVRLAGTWLACGQIKVPEAEMKLLETRYTLFQRVE